MKKYFLMAIAILALIACKDDDDDKKTTELAEGYNYTFTVNVTSYWTKETHPTDFPMDAKFGKILGVTHGSDDVLFKVKDKASSWMESYFTNGSTVDFESYFSDYQDRSKVGDIIVENGFNATEGGSFSFTANSSNDKVSLLMKLSPSPDWFVAIQNVDLNPLATGGHLIYKVSAFDAGLFSGTTYTEKGSSTSESISYKSDSPLNFPDGGVNNFAIISIAFKKRDNIE